MKRKLCYFCTLLLMVVACVAWSQSTYTLGWGSASGDEGAFTNFTANTGEVKDILSFSTQQNDASNPAAYNQKSKELRLYYSSNGNGCSITLKPATGLTITSAVIWSGTSPNVEYSVD